MKARNGTGMCVTEKRESLDLSIYLSLESEPLLGRCGCVECLTLGSEKKQGKGVRLASVCKNS